MENCIVCLGASKFVFSRGCEACKDRLIASARSPDRATTRRSQTSLFQYMGKDMEEKVKKLLTQEKSGV